MSKNKRFKRKIKRLEKQRNFYIFYAHKWKNEWYNLNYKSSIMNKKMAIANIDLYLNKFYIKILTIIAIIELIIILFGI